MRRLSPEDFKLEETQAANRLDGIRSRDAEQSHAQADQAVLRFLRAVSPNVADAYERCREATGAWWYA